MATIVTVDTSVALKWLVKENGHELARSYLSALDDDKTYPRYRFSAPALLLLEAHNVLAKKFKNAMISYGAMVDGVEIIRSAVEIEAMDSTFAIAAGKRSVAAPYRSKQALGEPVMGVLRPFNIYDCVFIEHAQQRNCPLLTADAGQADIARAFGIEAILIAE